MHWGGSRLSKTELNIRGVDGDLREDGSDRGSEDNEISHHVDCDL